MIDTGEATVVDGLPLTRVREELVEVDPRASPAYDSIEELLEEFAATRIDRYALVEKVGSGSFGSVWAAFDPQLDRRVAIKLLFLRGMAESPEAELEKILSEAQMLAQINHPNVVALHDVRELDASWGAGKGRRGLYIVMEFLAGPTLREWLAERTRSWQEIVAVYAEAGEGLLAAHRLNLVHRDFKPANVMFGSDGRVRVVDFGVAGPVGCWPKLVAKTKVVGTPIYMAPEQHLGRAADARSDQYSFCVALYEALYRRRPYSGASAAALVKAKLTGPPSAPPRAAKVPARLHQVLQRGLAVDPEHRFENMAALLHELVDDRHVRRRRWVSIAASFAVVAAAGYGLARVDTHTHADESCAAPAQAFAGLWDEGVRERLSPRLGGTSSSPAALEAWHKLEGGLDAWTGRWAHSYEVACERSHTSALAFDGHAPARLCLERARRRLGGVTAALLEVEDGLLERAQDAVVGLPRPEDCLLQGGPAAAAPQLGPEREAAIMAIEGEVARARALRALGRYEEALGVARRAREQAEALEDHAGAAEAAHVEADALAVFERYDEALAASEAALSLALRANAPESAAWALLRKLRLHRRAGELEAARAVASVVEAYIDEQRLGPELTIERDVELGLLAQYERELSVAEELLTGALERARQYYGDEDPRLASMHGILGSLSVERGRGDEGLEHYRAALAIRRAIYGERHVVVAAALNNVATVLYERGELEAAGEDLREALAINEAVFGSESVKLVPYLMNLANVAEMSGDLDQALTYQERALAAGLAGLPAQHPTLARMHLSRASTYEQLGRLEHALADLRTSQSLHEQLYGPTHAETAVVMASVAEVLRALGDPSQLDEAARLEQLALAALARELPEEAESRGDAFAQLARVHRVRGEDEQALAWLERRVEFERETSGPGSRATARRKLELIAVLRELGRSVEGLALAQAAAHAFEQRDGERGARIEAELEAQIAGLRAELVE